MLAGTTPRHCSGKGTMPAAAAGSSMSLSCPNPMALRFSYIFAFSARIPICAMPTLEDLMIRWAVSVLPMALEAASATYPSATFSRAGQLNVSFVRAQPFSSAIPMTSGLRVDPGS